MLEEKNTWGEREKKMQPYGGEGEVPHLLDVKKEKGAPA